MRPSRTLLVLLAAWSWWAFVFVVLLLVCIFLHELGHFLMARRIGVRVLTGRVAAERCRWRVIRVHDMDYMDTRDGDGQRVDDVDEDERRIREAVRDYIRGSAPSGDDGGFGDDGGADGARGLERRVGVGERRRDEQAGRDRRAGGEDDDRRAQVRVVLAGEHEQRDVREPHDGVRAGEPQRGVVERLRHRQRGDEECRHRGEDDDPDGVVRRVPLFVRDGRNILLAPAGRALLPGLTVLGAAVYGALGAASIGKTDEFAGLVDRLLGGGDLDLLAGQELLGHDHIRSTQVYAHLLTRNPRPAQSCQIPLPFLWHVF